MKRFKFNEKVLGLFTLAGGIAAKAHRSEVSLSDIFRAVQLAAMSALKVVFGFAMPSKPMVIDEVWQERGIALPMSKGADAIFSRDNGEIRRVADAIRPFSQEAEPVLGPEHVVAGLALAAWRMPECDFAKALNGTLEMCGRPEVDDVFVNRMLKILATRAEQAAIDLTRCGARRQALVKALNETIIGNRRACDTLRRRVSDALGRRSPLPMVFLVVGPNGSGRRFLAETAANALAEGRPVVRVDFTHFVQGDLSTELTGRDHSWKDGGKEGVLSGPALMVPRPVFIVENVERGSAEAIALLSRILSGGHAFDAWHGEEAFFHDATFFILPGESVDDDDLMHTLGSEDAPQCRQVEMVVDLFPKLAPLRDCATVLLTTRCTAEETLEGARRAFKVQCKAFKHAFGCTLRLPADLPRIILETLPTLSVGMATRMVEELFVHLRDASFDALRKLGAKQLSLRLATTVALPPSEPEAFSAHTKRRIACAKRGVFDLHVRTEPELSAELTLRMVTMPCVEDCGFFAVRPATVAWEDLVGVGHVRRVIDATLAYLNLPAEARAKRLSPPTGLLLYGPPGTGKTMIAKAAASTLGVAFIYVTAADFLCKDPSDVHTVFATANRTKAILFIDEIDALGSREAGANAGIINAFLTELDGYASRDFLVIGATNYPDRLDPALCRDGRLGRRIHVDPCEQKAEVEALIHKLLAKAGCAWSDATVEFLAGLFTQRTPSAICAAVATLVTTLGTAGHPSEADLLRALNKGDSPTNEPSRDELHSVAIHEAGHALVCLALGIPLRQICVIEQDDTAGFVQIAPEDGAGTREYYRRRICLALGGALAEELFLGSFSDGASVDLKRARKFATRAPAERLSAAAILCEEECQASAAHELIESALAETRELLARERTFLNALVAQLERDRVCSARDALALWHNHHPVHAERKLLNEHS